MAAKKRLAPLPKFVGSTAWDLLDFITWVIQREPKRYDQGDWIQLVEHGYAHGYVKQNMPACGTIGCVAGWVDLLVTGRSTIIDIDRYADKTQHRARRILGLTSAHADELFDSNAVSAMRNVLPVARDEDGFYPHQGSTAYALLGVLHIRTFMLRYERRLKRTFVRKVA